MNRECTGRPIRAGVIVVEEQGVLCICVSPLKSSKREAHMLGNRKFL
jgi:hypothetical protein